MDLNQFWSEKYFLCYHFELSSSRNFCKKHVTVPYEVVLICRDEGNWRFAGDSFYLPSYTPIAIFDPYSLSKLLILKKTTVKVVLNMKFKQQD